MTVIQMIRVLLKGTIEEVNIGEGAGAGAVVDLQYIGEAGKAEGRDEAHLAGICIFSPSFLWLSCWLAMLC